MFQATNYYVKRYEGQHPNTPAAPFHYVRSTVPSLHTNMYEYVAPSRGASDSKVPVESLQTNTRNAKDELKLVVVGAR